MKTLVLALVVFASPAAAQFAPEQDRREALQHYRAGQEFMSAEQFEKAADAFQKAIVALPLEAKMAPVPTVRFRSLRGADMRFTYGVDPVDYSRWQLFSGPYLEAAVDSEQLVVKYRNKRRTLDFRRLTVQDSE